MLNLDNIKLNDIYNGLDKQKTYFNKTVIDKQIRDNYSDILDKYELLNPYEIPSVLSIGDCIRYTKNVANISKCVIVKLIKYADNNKYIDYICVCSTNNIKLWKLYISNYYVFKLNRSSLGYSLREKLNTYVSSKNIKMVYIPTNKSIDKYAELDKEINEILNNQ